MAAGINLVKVMLSLLAIVTLLPLTLAKSWANVSVKSTQFIGRQQTPDVTQVSRDGGFSSLVSGNSIWIYDDTECLGSEGNMLSFVANTAATSNPTTNVSEVHTYGVKQAGRDSRGRKMYAVVKQDIISTGGWISLTSDELDFNQKKKGLERFAIWPGASPTPADMDHSFFLAPLVHVDFDPKNGHPFEDRGLVLVSVSASKRQSFPEAKRQAEFTIPRDVLQYGGFATVVGFPESSPDGNTATNKRDIYLFVAADNGLQLARAPLEHCTDFNAYNFFDPVTNSFTKTSHSQDAEERLTYMPGKYASGNIFYSPYFKTFLFVYFNNYADSTFFLRFLDLNYLRPNNSTLWRPGGRNGDGILAEDIEAMVHYYWSPEILIYRSPQGAAGYNYAGSPHPEYFNRQYFAPSMYAPEQPLDQRRNAWFGADLVDERHAGGDGRHLLLSWTAQVKDVRIPWKTRREIWLAKVEFTELSEAARLLTGDSSRYEHAAYQLPEWLASAGMKRRRRSWWKTVLSPK